MVEGGIVPPDMPLDGSARDSTFEVQGLGFRV
jgi:hypothetical protein